MNQLGRQIFKSPGRLWRNVATVDPGLGGTGAAFWNEIGSAEDFGIVVPRSVCKQTYLHGNWHDRTRYIVDNLIAEIEAKCTRILVLEMPRLWSRSKKSHTAVASGKLFKLSALTGAIIYAARIRNIDVAEVYPDEWKGQLDDRLIHSRIYKKLGLKFPTHVHDAVGMGLAIQGVL